jgi:hypothetical protein
MDEDWQDDPLEKTPPVRRSSGYYASGVPKVSIVGACMYCGGTVRVATCVCGSCGRVTIVPDDGL